MSIYRIKWHENLSHFELPFTINDVRRLELKLDTVLDNFFNELFFPDKIEEMNKPINQ